MNSGLYETGTPLAGNLVTPKSILLERFREPCLTLLVALQGVVIFVVEPLEGMHVLPGFLIQILMLVTAGVVFFLASANRWAQAAIVLSALVDGATGLLSRTDPSSFVVVLDFAGRLVFFVAVTAILLHVVFGDEDGTYHRIQGAIAAYLNIALIFAFFYRIAGFFDSHAFSLQAGEGTELSRLIYFSFVTLTTTGYGDIVPLDPLVRSAANLESLVGQLFTAVLLARLVSIYFVPARKRRTARVNEMEDNAPRRIA